MGTRAADGKDLVDSRLFMYTMQFTMEWENIPNFHAILCLGKTLFLTRGEGKRDAYGIGQTLWEVCWHTICPVFAQEHRNPEE